MKWQRRITGLALLIIIHSIMVSAANARDWHVNGAAGSDEYSAWRVHSSFERAYHTIGQAVSKADAGDIIYVCAGSYPEYLSITKPLTIVGEGEVVIDGQGTEQSGVSIDRADGVVLLRNLTFARCSYGVYIHNSAVSIEDCVFKENASAVFVYDPDRHQVAVTKCAFLRNGNGIHSYYHPGAITVTSCDFVDNGTAVYRQWSNSAVAVDRTILAGNGKTFWYQDPEQGYLFVPEAVTSSNFYENDADPDLALSRSIIHSMPPIHCS